MRSDISDAIRDMTDSRRQTIAENANPYLSLVVARKETLLDDFNFTERRRVRRTTKDSISDVAITVAHPKAGRDDAEVYVAYVKNGHAYLRHSKIAAEISDVDWDEIDIGAPSALKCDIAFDCVKLTNRRGVSEYVSGNRLIMACISAAQVFYFDVNGGEVQTIEGFGISDLSLRQTPIGLALFYAKYGDVYYRIYANGQFGSEISVGVTLESNITGVSAFPTLDGFGIMAHSGDKLYRIIGDAELSNWGTWLEVETASGTGAIVEYYDGKREIFYDNDGFCYGIGNEFWAFNNNALLYKPSYAVIEFDHTNEGTVYFATLLHGDEDIVYFIRYAYMRDVSGYTRSVEHRLQTDNPITQINAALKNIDDSLYTSDATLFAPSSIMKLGVSYGDSDIVPMGFGYIDQATIEYGGEEISLSGRNRTGVSLNDQTLEEDKIWTDTPSLIVEHIMEEFGLEDYYVCDESADLADGNPQLIVLEVEAKTTGLKCLETLNKILTNDAANKQWKFEETFDGTIVVGYDDFRSRYIPKNYYNFNGKSDVFAQTVDRCIDGVYNKVHVTGVTPKGKEISYTYDVTNFRFWDVGEKRIYHADKITGIEKSELKKYAKALAKQLKYVGRVITYRMNLKPQMLIGDVAVITYGDEPEELGHITEIEHQLGEDGYFTQFTITSGGNVTAVGYAAAATRSRSTSAPQEIAYTADKSINGTNRIRRLADFFGASGSGTGISASTTIIQGDSVNLPELIRNIGYRLLDEPTSVQVQYDEDENEVKIKYSDPANISSYEPVPVDWAGTVIVRNENGAPLHPWDGILINNSTTRDEYKNDWFIDDNNVQRGSLYFYGIFPYHIALDDNDHPIKYYRWTKVVSVNTGLDLQPAIITNFEVDGVDVTVSFEIPALRNGSYASITLVAKKDGTPLSVDDGDEFITLTDSDTSAEVSGLDELSHYYFVIFSEDDQGNIASSEPQDCVTGERTTIDFFTDSFNSDLMKDGWDLATYQSDFGANPWTPTRLSQYFLSTYNLMIGNSNRDRMVVEDGILKRATFHHGASDVVYWIPINRVQGELKALEWDYCNLRSYGGSYDAIGILIGWVDSSNGWHQYTVAWIDSLWSSEWQHGEYTDLSPENPYIDYIGIYTCDGQPACKNIILTVL